MERIRSFFKKIGKMLNDKGYTLMEVAAVVAVTGTLAAVAMPVVADKIAAGKVAGATADVQAIKDAITSFVKDTGVPPFYTSASSGTPLPAYDSSDYFLLITNDGTDPAIAASLSGTTGAWPSGTQSGASNVGSLDGQLVTNTPNYPTLSSNAWKGPYLPSLLKDPWGHRYLVVIKGLAESDTKYAVYAISAGPNGKIETGFEQSIREDNVGSGSTGGSFATGGDDIISRIQ